MVGKNLLSSNVQRYYLMILEYENCMKLFDSELRVMRVLWENGEMPAKEIAVHLHKSVGWSRTTTYTVINKCIEKGAVVRIGEGFVCKPAISKEEIQNYEVNELVEKMYDGSADKLVASIIDNKLLTSKEIEHLKEIISKFE